MVKYDQPQVKHGSIRQLIKLDATEVEGFVLENGTYIIGKQSAEVAFKLPSSFSIFMRHINDLLALPLDFLDEIDSPTVFRIGINGKMAEREGYEPRTITEAATYISRCNQLGLLYQSEIKYARAADEWLRTVPALDKKIRFYTGYDRHIQSLKEYITAYSINASGNSQYKWILTLPEDFWKEILAFYGLVYEDLTQEPRVVAEILQELIFDRLSEQQLQKMRNQKPKMKYQKQEQIEQYLPFPELEKHYAIILSILNAASGSQAIFMQLLDKTLPKLVTMTTIWPETAPPQNPLASPRLKILNERLKIAIETPPKTKA